MRVVHVIPGMAREASGPSHSVPALCQALARQGVQVELHTHEGERPHEARYAFTCHRRWQVLSRLGISSQMLRALRAAASEADLIHGHSLWMMANVYPGWAARQTRCRVVMSPRGTLSPTAMRGGRWRKLAFWYLWQRRVLEDAVFIHATSEDEYGAIRAMGIRRPVAVIPNGVDLPSLSPRSAAPGSPARRLLFLGRIAPIKGLDNLLRAWAAVSPQFSEWELAITGTDERGHRGEMEALARQLGVERVVFTGPRYGEEKSRMYRSAELFVLPTHSENFAMAVAEALAHEVPAIVTKGAPWRGLENHGCGWWIDIGVEPLVACLRTALAASPEDLRDRGVKGREWMLRDFSWDAIGRMMAEAYRWSLGDRPLPTWVRPD